MKNSGCRVCFWVLILAGVLSHAAAQEQSSKSVGGEGEDSRAALVSLGSAAGTPGTSIVVPIYFTSPEGVDVGSLKLEVTFVSANLKFEKLELGIAAELANIGLNSSLQAGKNEKGVETSTLTIRTTSPAEDLKKRLPAGLLGYLALRISEKGGPATITLRAAAEATELGTNKSLTNLRVSDAQVEVLAPGTTPMVTCFFFTH